jgi:hypothetical protein
LSEIAQLRRIYLIWVILCRKTQKINKINCEYSKKLRNIDRKTIGFVV